MTPADWLRLNVRLDKIEARLYRIEGAISLGRYLGLIAAGVGGAIVGGLITRGAL